MIWGTLDPFVEGGPVLGRRVANTTFLEALLKADPYDAYHFFLTDESLGKTLKSWVYDRYPALIRREAIVTESYLNLGRRLADTSYHCMHLSDIFTRYTKLTQTRNATAANIFPITGVTHSLSYTHFMPEYFRHLWPGVSSRDAIIVTSRSARQAVEAIFNGLRENYGLDEKSFPSPRLASLPLGVDVDDLPSSEQHWTKGGEDNPGLVIRRELSLGEEPLFLYFGRLCPCSKMDLMPLFAALRRAEKLGLPPNGYALVLAGWVDDGDTLPDALCSYARSMGIKTHLFPRPDREQRRALFSAADIFVSPSDNLQETFGLSVAEAGAAGLPVIASDFDGYRDIVLHGESGLLVPTLGFSSSSGIETEALWWYDNQYHLRLAQACAVDVPALANALATLGTDREKRITMGQAGRRRIHALFSWEVVIRSYINLWDELAEKPLGDGEEDRLRRSAHPQGMRFAKYFNQHFTRVLDSDALESLRLKRTATGDALYRGALPLFLYAGLEYMLDQEVVKRLMLMTRKEILAKEALDSLSQYFMEKSGHTTIEIARENAEFTVLWCLKHDHIEIVRPEP